MPNEEPVNPSQGSVGVDGEAVRQLRMARGWTQERLAAEAKVSLNTVQHAEKGLRLRVDNLGRMAEKLKAPLAAVVCDAAKPLFGPPASPTNPSPDSIAGRPSRLFQLPPPLTDFVGRGDEVRQVVERLRTGGRRVGLSALRGMGGVGKTTVAIHVAHEVKDRFPDAQLFYNLLGMTAPVTPVEAMQRIIHDFFPHEADLPDTEHALLPRYRSVLADKRALVVLDNAAGESQVRNLIAGERTGFIVTSREALALDEVVSVELGELPADEALQLLRGIVLTKGTDAELRQVAQLCGHLPLALRVAGDFLRLKDGWPVAQYIEALREERFRWLRVGDGPEKNVEAVLMLSSAQLVNDDPDLATRWHYLADWPADFDAAAAAAAWAMDPRDRRVLADLSELADRSLILFDKRSARYRFHDLMKPIAEGLYS